MELRANALPADEPTESDPSVFYRLESSLRSAGLDEFDNPLGPPRVEVYLHRYRVLSRTPKGVWLDVYGFKKFVNLSARKRYALPTVEEAVESFLARKAARVRILTRQIENDLEAVEVVKRRYRPKKDAP